MNKNWRRGIEAGVLVGIVDVLLIFFADPSAGWSIMIQSLIAWIIIGWVVVTIDSKMNPFVHGVLLTVLINIPWYIQFVVIPKQWDHLIPLLIMSIVFGLWFGWVRNRCSYK